MTKILKRAQYKKWKIAVYDTDNEKGIWANFRIKRENTVTLGGTTDFKCTIEECIDAAKEKIDLIENSVKLTP